MLFILFFLAALNNGALAQPGPQWQYSRDVTLSAGTPLANYQVQITIPAGYYTGMNADGSDLRFYVGATPCSYWIEKWNTSGESFVWVKVPAASTTVLTMYYGNPAATAGSDGDNTFDFFDGFDGSSLNTTKWTNNSSGVGTVTVSGGQASLNNNSSTVNNVASILTPNPFSTGGASSFVIEAKHRETGYYRNRYYASDKNTESNGVGGLQYLPSGVSDYGLWGTKGGSTTGTFHGGGSGLTISAGTDYLTRWNISETGSKNFAWSNYDYNSGAQLSYIDYSITVSIRYLIFSVTEMTNASTLIDWVRVRKSTATPYTPTVTFGTQISLPPTITSFTPISVCTDNTTMVPVTISGYNFTGATSVTFNGAAASSFTVVNNTTITAVSLAGISTGKISVTTPAGTATSSDDLVINALPTIYNLTVPGDGTYCTGNPGLDITLSGSQTDVNYQLYKGVLTDGSPVAGTGSSLTFLNKTEGSYYIVATNVLTSCSLNMSNTVTISENKITSFTVNGGGNFCAGGSGVPVGLTGSTAGVIYELFRGADLVATKNGTGTAMDFGPQTTAGTYTVKATLNGCEKDMDGSATVGINPLPSGALSFTESSGTTPNDGKICKEDTITFTATPDANLTYNFMVDGISIQNSPSNIFGTRALPEGNKAVTVAITNTATTCSITSAEQTITINPLPTPTLSLSKNNICPNEHVTFTAGGGTYYTFYINNVQKVAGPSSTYTYSAFANGDKVKVAVKNGNGCTKISDEITMTVKPLPGAAGTITGTSELCQGSTGISYSVGDISEVNGAQPYVWSYSGGTGATINNNGSKAITINFPNNATSGILTVKGQNGCDFGTASPEYPITINKLPNATVSGTTTVCQSSAQPNITFTGSDGVANYTFYYTLNGTPNSGISSGTTAIITQPTGTAGNYVYTLTSVSDTKGCSKAATGSATVTINPLPLKPATPAGTAAVCQGSTGSYVADITYANANGYHWAYSGNGATIHGDTKNIIIDFDNTATSGDLTVYGENSCGVGVVSDVYHITVNPLPTANISVASNPKVCQNSPDKPEITFTGLTGSAPFTFTYNINGGSNKIIVAPGNSITLQAPTDVAGTFTYNLVSVQDGSSTHCSQGQPLSVSVTIDTLPVPVLIGPDQICPDQELGYKTQSGSGISNYLWTINGGTPIYGGGTNNDTVRVHWANNTLPKSIYVNYTDGNGCQGATQVSVVSTSPATPVITSVDVALCLNSTGMYSTQKDDGAGNDFTDYEWEVSPGGQITSDATGNEITVQWNTAGPQYVKVNFNSGTCSAPAPANFPVTVNPLPTATVVTDNADVCQNNTEPVITFTGSNGTAPYTFTYTINGVAQTDVVSSGNTATITQPTGTPGDYIYALTSVSDHNSCSQTLTNPTPVKVTIHTLPNATVATNKEAVCQNDLSLPVITFTGSNGTAPYTFTYTINGVAQTDVVSSGNTQTINAPTNNPGTFEYILTSVKDASGCVQAITDQSATITVNSLPTASISGPDSVCLGETANITLTGANGTAPYTFIYTLNGGTQIQAISSGNDAVISVNTSTAGSFKFDLVSVQDNTATACIQNQTGSQTVIVSPATVGGNISGSKTICTDGSGSLTLSGETGKILGWQSSTDGTNWSAINNITHSLNYSGLTDTTQYRAVIKSGFCGILYSAIATINVNTANGGKLTVAGSNTKILCAGTVTSVINTGFTGVNIKRWETSIDSGAHWVSHFDEHNYYYDITANETTWYRSVSENTPCGETYSDTAKVIVNQRPTGEIPTGNAHQICEGGSATITVALTGSGTIHGTLSDGTTFSGTQGTIYLPFTPAASTDYTIATLSDDNCTALPSDLTGVGSIYITTTPSSVVISPAAPVICAGGIIPLTSVLSSVQNPVLVTQSKTVSQTIPNQNLTGLTSTINITGIPAGAIVDSVAVKLNITHTEVYDIAVNLAAPNGKVITLVASAYGVNFTNTIFHSNGSIYPVITSGSAPYTGTFKAEGEGKFAALFGAANTNTFNDLFGTQVNPPDGDWKLSVYDKGPFGTGSWNDWGLTIYYHVPQQPVKITWSPVDGLYTDPSATIPYTITDTLATVYAKPSITTTYTGTSVNPASCTPPSQVTVTVNPPPDVKVAADYCTVPGKVMLTASQSDGTPFPTGSTYLWNTGETVASVNVDEAHLYIVSVKTGSGCVGTGLMSVAQELVTNGDFEAPFDHNNPGFVTGYTWNQSPYPPSPNTGSTNPNRGLIDEGTYAVDTSAYIYHFLFHGRDHTTPAQTGKFMMLNGTTSSGVTIWQQTVNVLPNTNYYYSAWAMNLNSGSNARLQFSVNGDPIGTIAELGNFSAPGNEAGININNWHRFYYGNTNGWNSGNNTTAVITIINLNQAGGGNDFALDDISFATLSTFITKTSDPQSDNQTVCKGDLITPISYTVGSGGAGPLIQGLPKGVTADFNGIVLTISGRPDTIGTFNYSVTTQGTCKPTTATGVLIVNGPSIKLTSAAKTDSQVICKGAPLADIKYTVGGQGNGAYADGLPSGVGYSFASNVLTLSGAPDIAGIFKYKVYVTGGCSIDSLVGTITSNMQTISKLSGSDEQEICINTPIEDIKYEIGGTGTGAHITPVLPTGLSGTYSGGVFTITGTPQVAGIYSFTVTTEGICGAVAMTGKITVTANASINLSSAAGTDNQEICINSGITQIIYQTNGKITNAVATGLPAGLTQSFNTTTGLLTITGVPVASGIFAYTVQTSGSCIQAQATGTITVDPAVSGGTLALTYDAGCSSASGTLQLNGQQGSVKQWEQSVDGGLTWQPINNTSGILSYAFSGITQSTYFHALIDGGKCGDVPSDAVLVGLHNLWAGTQDDDWHNSPNWSDGQVPSYSTTCTDVIIPHVPPGDYQPVLSLGTASVNNIIINSNASLTLNGGIFQIGGSITNNGTFDARNGTIDFNSNAAVQSFGGSQLKDHALGNLVISNSTADGVSVTDSLDIYRSLTFGSNGKNLNSNGHLNIKSTADETAWIGNMTGHIINGDVTVERYIKTPKKWQLLAVPTQTTQTIHQAWQENQAPGSVGTPGFGTNITGPTGTGFDFNSPGYSVKYWSPGINDFTGINNTNTTFLNRDEGYFVFVRGDRQATQVSATPHLPTVLRTKGPINTGNYPINIPPNTFYSVGNPYASRVQFDKITGVDAVGLDKTYYAWDPLLGGSYGVGGYQTLKSINNYWPTAPGTDYYQSGVSYPNIESGQAFYVNNTSGNSITLTFNEAAKNSGSHLVFRGGITSGRQFFRTYLYAPSGAIADGNAVVFGDEFRNRVDGNDAVKILNAGENLGLLRDGKLLAIEARAPVNANDTLYFNIKNLVKGVYHIHFEPENMASDNLSAYLVDSYLKTTTEVSLAGKTSVDFDINADAASAVANRFMIVFRQMAALPVTFASIKAYPKDKDIAVEWKVENEKGMLQYELEKSVDGINFNKTATVPAGNTGSATYQWTDKNAGIGYNYYRVRSVDKDGKIEYSTVVKVLISDGTSSMMVYPNPITDGVIHLQMKNQPAGMYMVRLLNPLGQLIAAKQTGHAGGNGSIDMKWDYNLAHGIYQLEVTKPDGDIKVIKVMY